MSAEGIVTTCSTCRREFVGPRPDGKGGPAPLPLGISHLDGESRAFCWDCARRQHWDALRASCGPKRSVGFDWEWKS
jgi:hypothetical protein